MSDARKEKINQDQAWEIFSTCRIIHIARGKSVLSFQPDSNTKEDILKAAIGRSGTLRAPAVREEDVMWIGFNEDIYKAAR